MAEIDLAEPKTFGDLRRLCELGLLERAGALMGEGPVDEKDTLGATAGTWAIRNGYTDVLKRLELNEVDLEAVAYGGLTPVHLAANYGHIDAVTHLSGKVDASSGDAYGNTALHLAARKGIIAVVAPLVEAGADVNAKNKAGATPMHFAANAGHASLIKFLAEQEADISPVDKQLATPLHLASAAGHLEAVETLLSLGSDVKATDREGKSARDVATTPAVELVFEKAVGPTS